MAKFVYRLKAGKHVEGSKRNPKTGKKSPSKRYTKGDLIYTDSDLLKKFGPAAAAKFELCEQAPAVPAQPQVVPAVEEVEEIDDTYEEVGTDDIVDTEDQEDEQEEVAEDDGLMEMTVNALKAYAKEQEIDLGHAKKKTDIVEAIRDELEVREEE